jgi:hypothetical protein
LHFGQNASREVSSQIRACRGFCHVIDESKEGLKMINNLFTSTRIMMNEKYNRMTFLSSRLCWQVSVPFHPPFCP